MRLVTRHERVAQAPARWRRVYASYAPDHRFAGGRVVGEIADALERAQSDADIIAALPHWCEHKCDECGADHEVLVRFGEEPGYDARWQDLCAACCTAGLAALSSAKPALGEGSRDEP